MQRPPTPFPRSPDELIYELKMATKASIKLARSYLPPTGSTLALILTLLFASNLIHRLVFRLSCSAADLESGSLWRLLTAPWVVPPSGALWPLLLMLFVAYQSSGLASGQLRSARPFWMVAVSWGSVTALDYPLGGIIWPILMSAAMWVWFAEPLARLSPQSKSKLQRALLISSSVGIITGALYLVVTGHLRPLTGDHLFIRPLLAAWGYRIGPHFIPVIKLRGRSLKWVVLLFCLFECLVTPSPQSFSGLGATLALALWWEGPDELKRQLMTRR